MKRLKSFVVILILVVGAFFFASANQCAARQSEYSPRSYGVLRMKHSPTLGFNIPISVWIDGGQAGTFSKGVVYERQLAPGWHTVYARRPGRQGDSWHGTLNVRAGETYSFVVKATPNQVYLLPVSRID